VLVAGKGHEAEQVVGQLAVTSPIAKSCSSGRAVTLVENAELGDGLGMLFRVKRSIVAVAVCHGCSPSPRVCPTRERRAAAGDVQRAGANPCASSVRLASERPRALEAECFAEPWVPADARYAPKTLSGRKRSAWPSCSSRRERLP